MEELIKILINNIQIIERLEFETVSPIVEVIFLKLIIYCTTVFKNLCNKRKHSAYVTKPLTKLTPEISPIQRF